MEAVRRVAVLAVTGYADEAAEGDRAQAHLGGAESAAEQDRAEADGELANADPEGPGGEGVPRLMNGDDQAYAEQRERDAEQGRHALTLRRVVAGRK
jgi:hypothetical protein